MPTNPDVEWLELTDFSPGIHSNRNLAGGIPVTSTNLALASPENTYRCRSLPTGGLGPLPRRKFDFALEDPPGPNGTIRYVNGLGTWGQVFVTLGGGSTDPDHRIEVHLPISWTSDLDPDIINDFAWVRERIYETPQETEIIYTDQSVGDIAPEKVQFAFLMKTRTTNGGAPLEAGQPVMVCVYGGYAQGLRVSKAHPDPSTPTSSTPVTMGDTTRLWRRAVAHQNRIAFGQYISYDRGDTTTLSTEENIWFTAVNDVAMETSQPEQYVPEVDASITDWASMSANQMVVVKSIGGGYVLTGSLGDVTVVRLPNLMSPDGAETVQGCNTPIGWVYSAGDHGLYVWNGGDASVPLSTQLDGQVFTETGGIDFGDGSHRGQCDRWMDLLLAPNLYVCDLMSQAKGWWRLDDPTETVYDDRPVCYFSTSKYESQAIGAHAAFTDDTDKVFYLWQYNDLAYSYSWQSHPFWISKDVEITTRECILACQGAGTVEVTLTDQTGAGTNYSFTVSSTDTITNYRIQTNCSAQYLTLRLQATGTSGEAEAPLIHRVFLAYEGTRHHIPETVATQTSVP